MMAYVGVKAFSYYNTAGNNYSKPLLGIQTPIVVGIGGLILGVILMFVSWPFFHRVLRPAPARGRRSRRCWTRHDRARRSIVRARARSAEARRAGPHSLGLR